MFREARSLQAFARSAAQTRGISIPHGRADRALSPNVLVMEYIGDGLAIASPDLPEWRFKSAALHILHFLYRMIFIDGFVHCDLHPGNIRVRDDGSVYLFDAGLVALLSAADRERNRLRGFLEIASRSKQVDEARLFLDALAARTAGQP